MNKGEMLRILNKELGRWFQLKVKDKNAEKMFRLYWDLILLVQDETLPYIEFDVRTTKIQGGCVADKKLDVGPVLPDFSFMSSYIMMPDDTYKGVKP